MGNPINAIDPDGRDIIILHNKEGAKVLGKEYGHNALLIGSDKNGWMLFSKNGEDFIVAGGEKFESAIEFESLSDFATDENQAKYETGVSFTTEPTTDMQAQLKALDLVDDEYSFGQDDGGNCADLTSDVPQSVGIPVPKPQLTIEAGIISFTITDPKAQIEQAKTIPGAKVIDFDKIREKDDE